MHSKIVLLSETELLSFTVIDAGKANNICADQPAHPHYHFSIYRSIYRSDASLQSTHCFPYLEANLFPLLINPRWR